MQDIYLATLTKKDSGKDYDERGHWAYVSLFPPPTSTLIWELEPSKDMTK